MANIASGSDLALSVLERIPVLDGSNYRSWSFSMKMLLKARELWDVIEYETSNVRTRKSTSEGTPEAPQPQHDAAWRRKDQLTLSSMVLSLKPEEQEQIYYIQVTAIGYKPERPVVIAFTHNGLPETYRSLRFTNPIIGRR
jgi:hypothetical protein